MPDVKREGSHQFHGLHLLELVLEDLDVGVSALPVVHLLDVQPHVGQTAGPETGLTGLDLSIQTVQCKVKISVGSLQGLGI